VFPPPPAALVLATWDTGGVLGLAARVVAAYQAIEAVKLLTRQGGAGTLLRLDFWQTRTHVVDVSERRPECPCCGGRAFEFLESTADSAVTLCGRNAMQVRPSGRVELSLERLAEWLGAVGEVRRTPYFLKCALRDPAAVALTVFADGRALIHGVNEAGRAKAIYARFVGA
jgi:adenylyltransferase/sulfurtransferase